MPYQNTFPELALAAVSRELERLRLEQVKRQGPQLMQGGLRSRAARWRIFTAENVLARFMAKFSEGSENECWNWIGKPASNGYGRMFVRWEMWPAHRFSFLVFNGINPGAQLVCHRCDNPLCVNPDHLFLGTVKVNAEDMVQKGRQCKGERCHKNKLTRDQVVEIRSRYASGESTLSISKQCGVSNGNIWFIVTGKTWKHLLPRNAQGVPSPRT